MLKIMYIMHGKFCNYQIQIFIIGTGKNNSVKTFLQKTFEKLGLNYKDHLKINKKLLDLLKQSI